MTISVGITIFGSGTAEVHEAVLIAADQAMYQAKEEGAGTGSSFPRARGAPRRSRRLQTTTARFRTRSPTTASACTPSDPRPQLGRGRALRAAAADDRRRTASCSRRRPSSRPRSARGWSRSSTVGWWAAPWSCSAGASARAHPVSTPRQSLRCLDGRPPVLEFIQRRPRRGRRRPRPLHLRDHRNRADRDMEKRRLRRPPVGVRRLVAIEGSAPVGPFLRLKRLPFDLIKIDGAFIRDMPNTTPTSSPSRRSCRSPARLGNRRSPSTSRTMRRPTCCAVTGSTWPRASTLASPSTSKRR